MVSSTSNSHIISLCTFLVCCYCYSCSAKDTITRGEFINDGDNYLESPGKKFRMGFFPHGNTTELRRYVGIWYTMDPKTIVWVGNRDKPVLDYTGVITVAEDGNFKVLNKDASVYFSTTTGNIAHYYINRRKFLYK
ncbi:putative non-specific serine/threonine protein kinase [Helianthus annuus]|uniref:Non-specific serine/threonine protein kinase n=1 Tax=Helianthus annuus TaxID=4232 RepID=A0A251THT5_HELAN|nr:putative non-specific serine/threonine protein kinase [Helianthus annuus]